ncbi:hypothetical protein HDZ31DRAFT_78415, partial [Schizophyllum fasciatum]
PLLRDHPGENLTVSGVSGALTGGLLRGVRSGPRAAASGALILGGITTSLQYAFNVVREPAPAAAPSAAKQRLTDAALSVFGIYPMSIDDQIASLARKRDHHIKRIRELEDELRVPHDEALAPPSRSGAEPPSRP